MAEPRGICYCRAWDLWGHRGKKHCRSRQHSLRHGPHAKLRDPRETIAATSCRSIQRRQSCELLRPSFSRDCTGHYVSGSHLQQPNLRKDLERIRWANHANGLEICFLIKNKPQKSTRNTKENLSCESCAFL